MEPKEKAKELVEKFKPYCAGNSQTILNLKLAKKCALIAVDEILNIVPFGDHKIKKEYESTCREPNYLFQTYWEEVKQEIEKL